MKSHRGRNRTEKDRVQDVGPARPGLYTTARFLVTFLVLIGLFSSLASSRWLAPVLHERLTALIARLSASILVPFGETSVSGHFLTFNGFAASVEGACDGVQPIYIYLAAVLAFPSCSRAKGWGVLVGIPAVFLINFLRVATMMLFGAFWPDLFEWTHLYGWQALVIILTMGVWIFWAERFVRPRNQAAS